MKSDFHKQLITLNVISFGGLCCIKFFKIPFSRLSTFYNGRKHKATEALRKSSELGAFPPNILSDVDMALSGGESSVL